MLAIRDRKGRTWCARLTFDAALVLRDLGGIDVMAMGADGDSERRLTKPGRAADAIYLLCKQEADALRLSSWRFGKRFVGLHEELTRAWRDEMVEFFRRPGPQPKGDGGQSWTAAELWREAYWNAGEAGVDPGPYTWGELATLAEGNRRAEWIRLAFLRAALGDGKTKLEDLDITGAIRDLRRRTGPTTGKELIAGLGAAFGLKKRTAAPAEPPALGA